MTSAFNTVAAVAVVFPATFLVATAPLVNSRRMLVEKYGRVGRSLVK